MPQPAPAHAGGRGGLRARAHRIAEAPHRHFVTRQRQGRSEQGNLRAGLLRGEMPKSAPAHAEGPAATAHPRHRRTLLPSPQNRSSVHAHHANRADAFGRPTEPSRPRSPRLILTEPRQTKLIAPTPPDQIEATPKTRPTTKNPPKLITAAHAPLLPPRGSCQTAPCLCTGRGLSRPRTHAALPAAPQRANICAGV